MARILVIDDEEGFRELIVDVLVDAGYEVAEAGNGKEGLEAIMAERPDLVLCDVVMPGMDGIDMLREIRTRHPELSHLPIVCFSGLLDRRQIAVVLALGAADFFTKPLDIDVLLTKIEAILSGADDAFVPTFASS